MLPFRTLLVAAIPALSLQTDDAPTPAERRIAQAQRALEENPDNLRARDQLGWALAKRARETADPAHYAAAREAVAANLKVDADRYDTRKLAVWLDLGEHEFERALHGAVALNEEVPDDVEVYGFLVDAYVELGRYDDAEKAAQWMLDLRPGNVPGLTRAAYLRELFGDVDGSLELMGLAYHAIDPTETEERAWVLTHMGSLSLSVGRTEVAASMLNRALATFPGYHYALAALAEVRSEEGDDEAALELFRERYEVAPHPENLYDVAVVLERLGRTGEAADAFARFEALALEEAESVDNANTALVEHLAGRADAATEALRIAKMEAARRGDHHTRAALARALFATGDAEAARAELEAALEVGILDAELFLFAGELALVTGDAEAARQRLEAALDLRPEAPFSDEIRTALARASE